MIVSSMSSSTRAPATQNALRVLLKANGIEAETAAEIDTPVFVTGIVYQ